MLLSDNSTNPPLKLGARALWGHVVLLGGEWIICETPKWCPERKASFILWLSWLEIKNFGPFEEEDESFY